jgi:hemerythrin superfamily protein
MSLFDKIMAAVTPPESDAARGEARAKARAVAGANDWLALVLHHHEQIEQAFAAVKDAREPHQRVAAQKRLGVILTGHSIAEEAVLYPALVQADEKGHSEMAYAEQAAAKTQMAELESIAPMTQEYLDKLEHIRGAVAHHVYEEEGTWFLELKSKLTEAQQSRLTQRYMEEFERYAGRDFARQESRRPSRAGA